MKLLIISNMAHFRLKDGNLVGWGPAAQEIDALATLFEKVRHVGCLHHGEAPASFLPYHANNLEFIPLSPEGGKTFFSKLKILMRFPQYIRVIYEELKSADVVHVRCPANIPLIALFILAWVRRPSRLWVKYAGNWQPKYDPWSYGLQRWMLKKNIHRGWVTVNGKWGNQPSHIRSFLNPCFSREELKAAKQNSDKKNLHTPYRFIYVGALEVYKGVFYLLEIALKLKEKSIPFTLDIVGDGSLRFELEQKAKKIKLDSCINFLGWKSRRELGDFYRNAHFILLPSISEGWPKVLSEAMAYGVVPLASQVSCIPEYLEEFGTGRTFLPSDASGFVESILKYLQSPEIWNKESRSSQDAASYFTYEVYLDAVRGLLKLHE